jgi:hypothetical protein
MIPKYKRKAIIGIGPGLGLCATGIIANGYEHAPWWIVIPPFLGGICIYAWGCLALAKAKGYSTAIVLTLPMCVVLPAVILLALPDKHKQHRT